MTIGDQQELSTNSVKWFCEVDGKQSGATSEDEMIKLMRDSRLHPESLVWRDGLASWFKLDKTELASYLDTPKAPPLVSIGRFDPLVWVLAMTPLIGQVLRGFVIGTMYPDDLEQMLTAISENHLWVIPVVIIVGLAALDEKQLRNAGVNTNTFRLWIWLLPVYLLLRSKALGHGLIYVCLGLAMFYYFFPFV